MARRYDTSISGPRITPRITGPTYTSGVSAGTEYVDITMSYTVTPDFIFFTLPPMTLTETRRAFVYSTSAT